MEPVRCKGGQPNLFGNHSETNRICHGAQGRQLTVTLAKHGATQGRWAEFLQGGTGSLALDWDLLTLDQLRLEALRLRVRFAGDELHIEDLSSRTLGGTANLTRNTADFGGSLRSVLEALEEQVVVLRLLAKQQEAGKVTVRIGHETEAEQMAGTSVISTAYGSSGKVFGGMGVLGPTRMDYPGTIANVAAVALYIGEVLGNR